MKLRSWRTVAPLAAVTVAVIGFLVWWAVRPQPTLVGLERLMVAGRYHALEGRLLDYLRVFPQDELARLMLARASVDRPDQNPELALEQLKWIRNPDPRWIAQVKAIEGEARFLLRRYDAAEAAWLDALRLDPRIPEIGWGLLNLYALQGRTDESRSLGMRLFAVEPDPHDRVQLLLQMIRHDAHAIAEDSIVHQLEPVVRDNPGDLRSTLALGAAMLKVGRVDEGLDLLRRAVASHHDDAGAWDVYLTALVDAGKHDTLARVLEELPAPLTRAPRADAARGWLAAQRHDWPEAAQAYRRAWEARPSDIVLAYRLELALRAAEQEGEIERLGPRLRAIAETPEKLRRLYDQIDALPELGQVPRPDLYEEVAETLEPLARVDEAKAWRGLAPSKQAKAP